MHTCNWNTVEWETKNNLPVFIYGDGTVERSGTCKACSKQFREIYLKVGVFSGSEEIDLTE
jgi:hypothetical protein